MRAIAFALVLATATLGGVRDVRADQQADVAAAQKLYDEGKHLYDLGKFDDALDRFTRAYDLYRAPEFLFNIGQCYRNLKAWEKGIFVFESYLRDKPKTDKRALVEQLIAEMKQSLADEQAKAAADAQVKADLEKKQQELALEKQKREQDLALERQQQQQELELERQQREAEQAAARDRRKPIYTKWWFWTVAGGVAVAATGGIYWSTTGNGLPAGTLGTIDGR